MSGIVVPITASADLGDFKRVERQMQSMAKQAHKTSSGFDMFAKTLKRTIGIGALIAVGKKAIDEAQQAYQVSQLTNVILKNTGANAYTSVQQVSALAQSLSNLTGVDDELVQAGSNVLLSFGNIRNAGKGSAAVFDRATAAAVDMSKAMGTDVASASKVLGKALADPVKGVQQLRRAGVLLTAEQQAQIKVLQQRGDLLGAQQVVLAAVEGRFKGAAAAMASPIERLQTMLNNLLEIVGTPILDALVPIVSALTPVFEALSPVLMVVGEAIAAIIAQLAPALIPLIGQLLLVVEPLLPVFVQLAALIAALIPVITPLLPLIIGLSKFLGGFLVSSINLVIVTVRALIIALQQMVNVIADAFSWVPKLGDELQKAKTHVQAVVDGLDKASKTKFDPSALKALDAVSTKYEASAKQLAAGAKATNAAGKSFGSTAKKSKVVTPKLAPVVSPTRGSTAGSFTVAGSGGGLALSVTINGTVIQEKDVARSIRDELKLLGQRRGVNVALGV